MKKILQKWTPPVLMLVMAAWFFGQLQAPKDKDFAFSQFGQLPVVFDGRLKPMIPSRAIRSSKSARSRRSTPSRGKVGTSHPKSSPAPNGSLM